MSNAGKLFEKDRSGMDPNVPGGLTRMISICILGEDILVKSGRISWRKYVCIVARVKKT